MSLIGIIAENKNEGYIYKQISERLQGNTIMTINEKTIENVQNVRFETIVISGNNAKIFTKAEELKKILSNVKYLIINADIEMNLKFLDQLNLIVITVGFNSKSTITASSVKEDSLLICIQRTIHNKQQKEIELQEIEVNITNKTVNIHMIMAIMATLLIYGVQDFGGF